MAMMHSRDKPSNWSVVDVGSQEVVAHFSNKKKAMKDMADRNRQPGNQGRYIVEQCRGQGEYV